MMRRIYTRTGDNGTTGIFGGERVEKDDIRIEANGTIDELNTVIRIVRSLLPEQDEWHEWLYEIQMELMSCMSHVATPFVKRGENPNTLRTELTGLLEKRMDTMNTAMEDNGYFILPGGTQISAQLHHARVIARRAERRLCTLHRRTRCRNLFLNSSTDYPTCSLSSHAMKCIGSTGLKRNGKLSVITAGSTPHQSK